MRCFAVTSKSGRKISPPSGDPKRKCLNDNRDDDVFIFANPVTVCMELLVKIREAFPDYLTLVDCPNTLESLCADELLKKLFSVKDKYEYVEELEIDDDCDGKEAGPDSEFRDSDGNILRKEPDLVPVEEKAEILAKIAPFLGKRSFKWIQGHGGSKLLYENYKRRWEEHVRAGRTCREKFMKIDAEVWERFCEARQELRSIHGFDIKAWGIQAASRFPSSPSFQFRASDAWVDDFKKRHNVSSRKINKLVKRKKLASAELNNDLIEKFRNHAQNTVAKYRTDHVINWDQSGCAYEVTSKRTLTHKGEPWTLCSAWSPSNRATHSYTIQYAIAASGKVVGPVYVCLQEPDGRLGPQVEASLPATPNVLLTRSKSGKLTSFLADYFLDQFLVPYVKEKGRGLAFIVDHWGGQVDKSHYTTRFGVQGVPKCEVLTVRKGCTSQCQPCDVIFYRQVKYFLKRITEYVQLNQMDSHGDPIHSRWNILTLHSLVHYQLSASLFEPTIRYSWYKAGICNAKEPYLNVKQACFSFNATSCDVSACKNAVFLKCARCAKHLCFNCFFYEYHTPFNGCVDFAAPLQNESQESVSSMEE